MSDGDDARYTFENRRKSPVQTRGAFRFGEIAMSQLLRLTEIAFGSDTMSEHRAKSNFEYF